ncbi:unnamed protein product [Rotaria sp. Silwood1]|nr:unnamed protein product [Rotaria sp. Silwood1]CAF1156005.1 unnamed protein product [Rotaria sp. Silwood1]CAF3422543.1 unnamed protein product [Rotaria sp. Silwood1]CAF4714099.1 unnamed protein product [Rotaria sp. Silwood1]
MDRFHDEQTPFVFIDGIEKLSYKIAYINLTESSKKALFMTKAEISGIMRLRKSSCNPLSTQDHIAAA